MIAASKPRQFEFHFGAMARYVKRLGERNPAYPVRLFFRRSVTIGEQLTDDPQEVVHSVEMPIAEFDELLPAVR